VQKSKLVALNFFFVGLVRNILAGTRVCDEKLRPANSENGFLCQNVTYRLTVNKDPPNKTLLSQNQPKRFNLAGFLHVKPGKNG
jgi:hypothetical protein